MTEEQTKKIASDAFKDASKEVTDIFEQFIKNGLLFLAKNREEIYTEEIRAMYVGMVAGSELSIESLRIFTKYIGIFGVNKDIIDIITKLIDKVARSNAELIDSHMEKMGEEPDQKEGDQQ
jgi:hypothetical protein